MNIGSYDFGGDLTLREDIDLNKSPEQQEWSLVEDILNVSYQNGMHLDLSWDEEFNPKGKFILIVVENGDWDNPKVRKEVNYADIIKELDSVIRTYIFSHN